MMTDCFKTHKVSNCLYDRSGIWGQFYEGAKDAFFGRRLIRKNFLTGLFHAMYDELPPPKPKKEKIGIAKGKQINGQGNFVYTW